MKGSSFFKMIIRKPPVFFLLAFLVACAGDSARAGAREQGADGYQRITAHQAHDMMQRMGSNGFVLVDVRTAMEFRAEHIAGAILIPVDQMQRRAAAELPDKDAVILIYCRTGARASTAAGILADKGYTQVFNIGGIESWPFGTVR